MRAHGLGAADSVIFAGMVERHEIPAYLAVADIVVVPSVRYEGYVDGLPNVALEAMAAGKPLVATRVGGLPELVRPGETGLLVEEKDADELADAIVTLARDPNAGANGRQRPNADPRLDELGFGRRAVRGGVRACQAGSDASLPT